MKVVLTKDVPKVGKKGEVAEVSRGFGVNYLISKGLAEHATKDSIQKARQKTKERKERESKQEEALDSLFKRVNGKKFQIKAEASKSGRLYGSLDQSAVEKDLAKQWGISGEGVAVQADLAQPIRDTGKYPLDVKVSGRGKEQTLMVVLAVVPE